MQRIVQPIVQKLAMFSVLGWVLYTPVVSAKFPPATHWSTLKSEHFRVHYPTSYLEFTRRLVTELESAYRILSKELHWELSSVTDVVVPGNTDQANGYTSVFPFNRLVIHPVAPPLASSLGEAEDWIRLLAIHELTHLMAHDQTRGLFGAARTVMGSVAKVNQLWPPFLQEGLAVYYETKFASGGRGVSTYQKMLLRALAQEGWNLTLDRLSSVNPNWPAGQTPYVLGYELWKKYAEKKGVGALGDFANAQSFRIPYFYGAIWGEILDEVVAREKSATTFHAIGGERIVKSGRNSMSPILDSAQEYLYWIDEQDESGFSLSRFGLHDKSLKHLVHWPSLPTGRLRFDAKEKRIYYSRRDSFDQFEDFSDIFYFDIPASREVQLTHGQRAFDPVSAPTRGEVYFIRNLETGNQSLKVAHTAYPDGAKTLLTGSDFTRFGNLALSPDERRLIFVSKKTSGECELMELNLATGVIQSLYRTRATIVSPSFSKDGSIYFSMSDGKSYALFKWGSGTQAYKVYAPETGIWYAEPSDLGEWYGSELTGHGFEIVKFTLNVGEGERVEGLHSAINIEALANTSTTAESYGSFPALFPHYWYPYAEKVTDGYTLGILTSGYDSLELHRYSVQGSYDSRASFPLYQLSYSYDGLYPTLTLKREQTDQYLAFFKRANRSVTSSLVSSYPLSMEAKLELGAQLTDSRFLNEEASSGGFSAQFTHSQFEVFPASIDSEKGTEGHKVQLSVTGFLTGENQFTAWQGLCEKRTPTWGGQFIKFQASGAHSTNAALASLYFVGGGEESISNTHTYLLRGFPIGQIYGRDLAVFNTEYYMPIQELFRGPGIWPVFSERAKLKFFADTGSSELIGNDLNHFTRWPLGVGVQLIEDLTLGYRWPVGLAVGVARGLSQKQGGETQITFGAYSRWD